MTRRRTILDIRQIAEWVDRHRDDVDPPQIAVEYVAYLLARLLTAPLTADECEALTAYTAEAQVHADEARKDG